MQAILDDKNIFKTLYFKKIWKCILKYMSKSDHTWPIHVFQAWFLKRVKL